jgi:hypothetical protein
MKLELSNIFRIATNLALLISVIILILEIQQNQTNMLAETSYLRTEMAITNGAIFLDGGLDILSKIRNGEDLSPQEKSTFSALMNRMLRYFENLHYLNELGILDYEIWEANITGISGLCDITQLTNNSFPTFIPNPESFRHSFIEYFHSSCN